MKQFNARLRKIVAVLRPFRPFIERPKISEHLFYLASFLTLCLVIEVLVSKKWSGISESLAIWISAASCIGFLMETHTQVKAAVASIWAKVLGKAMLGVLALLANYLSISLAKNFVHLVVHVDPKFFPEFMGIISIGITALIFLAAIQFLVSLLGFLRLVSSYLVVALHQIVSSFAPNAFNFVWRVLFGKQARFIAFKHSLFATFSFIGSIFLVVALAYPTTLLARHSDDMSSILTRILVAVEFRSGSSCTNLKPTSSIAYLDRGWVSMAEPIPSGFKFSLVQCEYAANPVVESNASQAGIRQPALRPSP